MMALFICCTLSDEKQKPLILGKLKIPRSLKNVDLNFIGVVYGLSCNACWLNKYFVLVSKKLILECHKKI